LSRGQQFPAAIGRPQPPHPAVQPEAPVLTRLKMKPAGIV
jgi:hypothetical protein